MLWIVYQLGASRTQWCPKLGRAISGLSPGTLESATWALMSVLVSLEGSVVVSPAVSPVGGGVRVAGWVVLAFHFGALSRMGRVGLGAGDGCPNSPLEPRRLRGCQPLWVLRVH